MNLFIKICGITNAKDAELAVRSGADALGFIMYQDSSRYIDSEKAGKIIRSLPKEITPIMVFVDASKEYVESCLSVSNKIVPQFHGDESPKFCSCFDRKFIKAIRVSKKEDINDGFKRYSNSWMILLDSYSTESYGGTGEEFNWLYLGDKDYGKSYIVAGGLSSNNVEKVLSLTSCAGLDISSGVESYPGKKDPVKMKNFIDTARRFNV